MQPTLAIHQHSVNLYGSRVHSHLTPLITRTSQIIALCITPGAVYFCVAKSFTPRYSYSIDVRVCVDGGGGRAEQVPVPTDGIKPVGTFPNTWTRGQFRVSPKPKSTSSAMIATGATGRVDSAINKIAVIVDLV